MKKWFTLAAVALWLLVACTGGGVIEPTAEVENTPTAPAADQEESPAAAEDEAEAVPTEEENTPTEEPAKATDEPAEATDEPAAEATPETTEPTDSTSAGEETSVTLETVANLRDTDWVKGASENPVLAIVEYGDFQCPACGAAYPILKQLTEDYPDDIQVVYRHFPLNHIHPYAQMMAEAAEAAGAQGKFWEYHDALFDNQGEASALSEDEIKPYLVDLADDLGLDTAQFEADLDNGTYKDKVNAFTEEAMTLAFSGTPTIFVNGEMIGGMPPYEAWVSYLEQMRVLAELESKQYLAAPEMTIDVTASYFATVEMENGDIFKIQLYPQSAPQTVNSFVFLAREGWFDGVTFHRVLPGFVAQTGDPSATGMGGPGYTIPNEIDPSLTHGEAGMVAMANSGPDTNGSQWYVTLDDASFLDGGYTIFGKVVEGLEFVQKITPRDPSTNPDAEPGDKIKTITIEEIK